MRDEILNFAIEMDKKMDERQKEKGDSWKTCDIDFLKNKLMKEVNEYCEDTTDRKELVDIANMCMMLFHRIVPISYGDLMKSNIFDSR